MKGNVPAYELAVPRSLEEALHRLSGEPGIWKPIAGGTDLMVLFQAGRLFQPMLLSLWKLPELRGIEATPEHVTLGALTTYTEVQRHPLLQTEFPLLTQAASWTGSIATQNRGTLGGNIANASPAADSSPVLLAYDAELELLSVRGPRWVPYHLFHTGYKQNLLAVDEIISRIRLPRVETPRHQYGRKVGTRRAQAITKIGFAGTLSRNGSVIQDVRIALSSVAPAVLRCRKTEDMLRGQVLDAATVEQAGNTLASEIAPIDDIRSTAQYRRRVAVNLLREFLHGA